MKLYEKMEQGVYIIAEMSANHGGDLKNALKIVEEAKKAGADCLKIQTYTPDTLTIPCDRSYFKIQNGLWKGRNLYELYQQAYTPWEWQEQIKETCEALGMDFLSTPFDGTAVDFLEGIHTEFYKIASFELVDLPLIEYVAKKHKPMIISCGMATPEEIQDAVDVCKNNGNHQIVLLRCCSQYPAPYEGMNLSVIQDMQQRFQLPVGLSDHSAGSLAAVVAVSLGAKVIEKHVCLSREMDSADAAFSMEMEEFKEMVDTIRQTVSIIGNGSYELTEGEKESLIFRRSIFAVKDIKKGESFTSENVRCIRPAHGLSPKYYKKILSQEASQDYSYGDPISREEIR